MKKIRILFVCLGNICRSPMAEYVMKELVRREGLADMFEIDSAGTSDEEQGNPVYPPARKKLAEKGVPCGDHRARRMKRSDYDYYDMIIGMSERNIRGICRISGGDPEGKISLLLDYTDRAGGDIADPWYTGDFEETWDDVSEGCEGLLRHIMKGE